MIAFVAMAQRGENHTGWLPRGAKHLKHVKPIKGVPKRGIFPEKVGDHHVKPHPPSNSSPKRVLVAGELQGRIRELANEDRLDHTRLRGGN
jgi:hypothetical protein